MVKPCKLVFLVDDLCHLGHRVVMVERMKMMAGQRSPKTRPTKLSQQGLTVLSRSRNIIYCVINGVENNKDNENHSSRRIKHLFLLSRKIINFAKSRFTATMEITIHEEKISHFTVHGKKKGPITSHENTLYHPLLLVLGLI